jgi:hypothetical protein
MAEAVDLAQQIGWLRQITAGSGFDHRQATRIERSDGVA